MDHLTHIPHLPRRVDVLDPRRLRELAQSRYMSRNKAEWADRACETLMQVAQALENSQRTTGRMLSVAMGNVPAHTENRTMSFN